LSRTPSATFALISSANSSLLNLDTFELSVKDSNLRMLEDPASMKKGTFESSIAVNL
jgi:hypothetical protein